MKEIILFLCGTSVGALIMGLMSAHSYNKGYEDGVKRGDENNE